MRFMERVRDFQIFLFQDMALVRDIESVLKSYLGILHTITNGVCDVDADRTIHHLERFLNLPINIVSTSICVRGPDSKLLSHQ